MKEKFYRTLREHFVKLETRLNQLDAVIGDGDHGTTLLKGLTAISNSKLPASRFNEIRSLATRKRFRCTTRNN